MSQLSEIETAQRTLEDCFAKRMSELEAQLGSGGSAKDTVARVADEFRTFRELMFKMLSLLRTQINECYKAVDIIETIEIIETRHRRKALILLGVMEVDREDSTSTVLNIMQKQLGLTDISAANINLCHRLGMPNKERPRPLLVRFNDIKLRSSVWKAKSKLKGSATSIREFLTKGRQIVFGKARTHFGMSSVWTQDGCIMVKAPNGERHKITSQDGLDTLMKKFPKTSNNSSSASRNDTGESSSTSKIVART